QPRDGRAPCRPRAPHRLRGLPGGAGADPRGPGGGPGRASGDAGRAGSDRGCRWPRLTLPPRGDQPADTPPGLGGDDRCPGDLGRKRLAGRAPGRASAHGGVAAHRRGAGPGDGIGEGHATSGAGVGERSRSDHGSDPRPGAGRGATSFRTAEGASLLFQSQPLDEPADIGGDDLRHRLRRRFVSFVRHRKPTRLAHAGQAGPATQLVFHLLGRLRERGPGRMAERNQSERREQEMSAPKISWKHCLALAVVALALGATAANAVSTITVPACTASTPNTDRFAGGCGAHVTFDGSATDAWVADFSPSGESEYRVRFMVNLSGLTTPGDFDNFVAYSGTDTNGTPPPRSSRFRITYGPAANGEENLFVSAPLTNGTEVTSTPGILLKHGWHSIEVHWLRSAPAQSNGLVELWVD